MPWTEVAVDTIGPWKIDIQGHALEFRALTCIDTVTNLTELIRLDNMTMNHITMKFENNWLTRYPRPLRCIHDNGPEFGATFLHMLQLNGIENAPMTIRNPQANAICERMHQTVGNILRTLLHAHPPNNIVQAQDIMDTALATAPHATRAAIHCTLHISPGALVFHQDMFLDIPLLANLQAIRNRRQVLINESNCKANLKCIRHDYRVGKLIMLVVPEPTKLDSKLVGLYPQDHSRYFKFMSMATLLFNVHHGSTNALTFIGSILINNNCLFQNVPLWQRRL
jgi:hypothetical protein